MFSSFSESAQPLTPTRTPTSATFIQASFETPKFESSFYDPRVTWNTADPFATTPDFLKTPKFLSFTTPNQSPILGLNRKRPLSGQNIEDQIAIHVDSRSPNPNPALPSVETPRPPVSSRKPSPSPLLEKETIGLAVKQKLTQARTGANEPADSATRSADSIQTPPLTSTSASRRKGELMQPSKVSKGSTSNIRRMSTPTGPKAKKGEVLSSQVEESPLQLGTLQFSPDGFGFSISGSTTVPGYPQHKLFWDTNQHVDGMNVDFPHEPFGLGLENSKNLDPFKSSHLKANVSHMPSASRDEFSIRNTREMNLESSSHQDIANQADLVSSNLMMQNVPKGVNPSLLFSSPSRPLQHSTPVSAVANEALQPYASQRQDAQTDRDSGFDRVSKRRRKLHDDSPAVKAALQALREETRSRTSTEDISDDIIPVTSCNVNVRTSRVYSRVSEQGRQTSSTRKAKRTTYNQASVRPSRGRTAVTLTVDENGRAKTETRTIYESIGTSALLPEVNSNEEPDSEESDSTSSSESDEMTISQQQSFAFPDLKAEKPKLPRFTTDSKTHSKKSSYASDLTPTRSRYNLAGSNKPGRRTSSARGPSSSSRQESPEKRKLHRVRPSIDMSDDVDRSRLGRDIHINSEVDTVTTSDDDRGDAQSALKKIVRVRAQSRPSTQAGRGKSSNTYPSRAQIHPELFGALAFGQGDGINALDNISPTTITDPDLSTPGTGRESVMSEATRCVCPGYEIEGELMILWYVETSLGERVLMSRQRFMQELAACGMCRAQSSPTSSNLLVCVLSWPNTNHPRWTFPRARKSSFSGV